MLLEECLQRILTEPTPEDLWMLQPVLRGQASPAAQRVQALPHTLHVIHDENAQLGQIVPYSISLAIPGSPTMISSILAQQLASYIGNGPHLGVTKRPILRSASGWRELGLQA